MQWIVLTNSSGDDEGVSSLDDVGTYVIEGSSNEEVLSKFIELTDEQSRGNIITIVLETERTLMYVQSLKRYLYS